MILFTYHIKWPTYATEYSKRTVLATPRSAPAVAVRARGTGSGYG